MYEIRQSHSDKFRSPGVACQFFKERFPAIVSKNILKLILMAKNIEYGRYVVYVCWVDLTFIRISSLVMAT